MSRTWSGERHLISDVTAWRDSILTRENTMQSNLKEAKIRDEKHRRFIASLPCIACRIEGQTQAAHIRSDNMAGMGLKSGDDCTVPLCISCHHYQHEVGEHPFWMPYGGTKKATETAKQLYAVTGDNYLAIEVMGAF